MRAAFLMREIIPLIWIKSVKDCTRNPAKKTPAKSPKAKAVAPKGGVAKKATPAKAKSPVKSPAPKAKKVEEKKGGCVIM